MKLEHIAFNVAEPEKAAEWYQAQFGLRLIVTQAPNFTAYFLADEAQSLIEFYRNPAVEPPDYSALHPATLHVAFYTDDPEAMRERLLAAGATPLGEKIVFPSGVQFYYVRDPWGLALQLIKRPAPLLG